MEGIQDLEKLNELKEKGILTEEEFQEQKRQLLKRDSSVPLQTSICKSKEYDVMQWILAFSPILCTVTWSFIWGFISGFYEGFTGEEGTLLDLMYIYPGAVIPGILLFNIILCGLDYKNLLKKDKTLTQLSQYWTIIGYLFQRGKVTGGNKIGILWIISMILTLFLM